MKAENSAKIQFDSLSANEAFARGAAAAFLARYDPTVPQLFRRVLDAQTAAQRPGAALPPQYQPDARRIDVYKRQAYA